MIGLWGIVRSLFLVSGLAFILWFCNARNDFLLLLLSSPSLPTCLLTTPLRLRTPSFFNSFLSPSRVRTHRRFLVTLSRHFRHTDTRACPSQLFMSFASWEVTHRTCPFTAFNPSSIVRSGGTEFTSSHHPAQAPGLAGAFGMNQQGVCAVLVRSLRLFLL